VNSLFTLSRIKRAIVNRLDLSTAARCAWQSQKKIVKFTGIASIRGNATRYASLEHFKNNIPVLWPGDHFDYLVTQQFLDEEFISEQRPKIFFSREPKAHHDNKLLTLLGQTDVTPHILSFGEENIERRMFYVALPDDRSGIIRRLRKSLHDSRPALCCIVNRYKESDRLNLLGERIRFVRAMGADIDIYGRTDPEGITGWRSYPNYHGPTANKLRTLARYTFNLCFENCEEDGYITEKIIQALMAGCIPLYRGGGRFLEQTIPGNCFINCKGENPAMIYDRIRTMSKDEILGYRKAGLEFITSTEADRFTWRYWAEMVAKRILE